MRVKVLYFGMLKDHAGAGDGMMDVPEGTTVRRLLDILRGRTSNKDMQDPLWRSLAVAVNREYSGLDTVLHEGDEVALLPPVSGGSYADGEKLASLAETLQQGQVR